MTREALGLLDAFLKWSGTAPMQFTALNLAPETLAGLGLSDMPEDVPTVDTEHVGVDPEACALGGDVILASEASRARQG